MPAFPAIAIRCLGEKQPSAIAKARGGVELNSQNSATGGFHGAF